MLDLRETFVLTRFPEYDSCSVLVLEGKDFKRVSGEAGSAKGSTGEVGSADASAGEAGCSGVARGETGSSVESTVSSSSECGGGEGVWL